MYIFFLISLGLHIMLTLVMILGGDLSWISTPKPPPTEIPVEFVPIAKESQGAISKPQVIEKEAEKEEEKAEPKPEKLEEIKPEEKPKPKPQETKKAEPEPEQVKPESTPEKPKPAPKEDVDPDAYPDKKKKDVKKEDKKKDLPKPELVKNPKKDAKKPVKKDPPKKEDKKSKVDDDFEQILKNLDTQPAPVKNDAKKETKGKKKNVTNKLSEEASMSLIDAMKRQVSQCWTLDAGVKDIESMTVLIDIKLRIDGTVESAEIASQDKARMNRDSFYRAFAEGAKRSILECAPYNLPPDMYDMEDGWKEIQLNFSPQDMLDQVQ